MAQSLGTFSLVLHSHIPYVLAHGRSPHGTDWLSEAAAETYLPLLDACHRLIAEGLSPKITLGLTPVLVEQLRDPSFQDELSGYLRGKVEAAQANQEQFRREGNYHMAYLARYWEDWYGRGLADFEGKYSRDIVGAFAALQDAGHLEVITSSATHGYSALLSQDTSIQAQVKTGIQAYERHFGRKPRGFWLPECSYRPRYKWAPSVAVPDVPWEPILRKGVDEFLAENGIEYFFVEGSLLHGGEALGVYADKFGPLKELYKQFQKETVKVEYRPYTTYHPYLVDSSGQGKNPPLAVFGRDAATGKQVWSGEHGYPGDEWYLEFHKKFVMAEEKSLGLRYWRISRDKADLGAKMLYEPHRADERAQAHAAHFVPLVKEVLTAQKDPTAIISAVYDTELFGHWWFEGPQFLYHALRQMALDPEITLQTAGEYLTQHPATQPVTLPEGSWGEGGFHYIWLNEQTAWSWKLVYEVEAEMSALARDYGDNVAAAPILRQAAREALLLMASDWQFCISTGGAKDYSEVRLRNHYGNFEALAGLIRKAGAGKELSVSDWKNIAECEARDSVFPDIEPRWFANVEASRGIKNMTETNHTSLRVKNFTAFRDALFDFVPGINVFVGENGTGKTHVMKALYAMQLTQSRESRSLATTLEDLFQTKDVADMIRVGTGKNAVADVAGSYANSEWSYAIQRGTPTGLAADNRIPRPERPVFIPAIDMMGHTKGFTEAYEEVKLDFDLTCRDIVNLLRLERRNGHSAGKEAAWSKSLNGILNGETEREDDGRFYLVTESGRQPMPLVAEGLRKIATLVQLERNGWLSPGTTLFWDEPEVNLNPILMDEVVGAILSLTRQNVQVFLATHSYVILKELDLQTRKEDSVRYFAFQRHDDGTTVSSTDDFSLLQPNPILDQYASLYDRELTRSTGRNRQGERVY